jgi:bifunctional ADP-heptose synthase (sugar kinase/adenylyltransferase)
VVFDSDEMLRELLERYKPDKFIIGSDYLGKEIIGQEFAKQIVIFNRLDKFSTTDILNHANNDNR